MADYPAMELAEVRGLLGSPTTTELSDTQIGTALSEILDKYSEWRPILSYDLDALSTSDADDFVTPPDGCMGVLAVMVDEDDIFDTDIAGAKNWLKNHVGTDDTMSDLTWMETGGLIIFDLVPADVYPCRVYYKLRHVFSATVTNEGDSGMPTIPTRDRVKIVDAVMARCLITLAGYGGELTFGSARISKENIKKQGTEGMRSFNRWIRQGAVAP